MTQRNQEPWGARQPDNPLTQPGVVDHETVRIHTQDQGDSRPVTEEVAVSSQVDYTVRQTGQSGDASQGGGIAEGTMVAETEEIRVEIEQTRAEMSETIDAIQERLNPRQLAADARETAKDTAASLAEEAKSAVREATLGKAEQMVNQIGGKMSHAADEVTSTAGHVVDSAGHTAKGATSSLMDTIRENPLPAALAGIGLGWLFMNRRSHPPAPRTYYPPTSGYGAPAFPTGGYPGYRSGARDSDSSGVGQTAGNVQEKAGELASHVKEAAGDVASNAGNVASAAGERIGDVASGAGSAATGAGSTLLDTIKQNPVPAALTGLGIAWLWSQRSDGSGANGYAQQSGGHTAYDAGYRTGEKIGDAATHASGMVSHATGQVGQLGSQIGHRAERVEARAERMLQQSPLAVGALALGVGTAIGLALPGTRQESRLMGDARDQLLDQVQSTAEEAGGKVQRVAKEAQKAASAEAKNQGIAQ